MADPTKVKRKKAKKVESQVDQVINTDFGQQKPQLNIAMISVRTISDLRRRGHTTPEIAAMTADRAFTEYCAYLGIFDAAHGPASVLRNLRQAMTKDRVISPS
jgi:ABC-type ATPase with predicted acetyltransferase domain